jgi:hypothetical protein
MKEIVKRKEAILKSIMEQVNETLFAKIDKALIYKN